MRLPRLRFLTSPESRLSDVLALLDSYAAELTDRGRVVLCVPLHMLDYNPDAADWDMPVPPTIDETLELRMIRYQPAPEPEDFLTGIRQRVTRWPFHVEQPLVAEFVLGAQWWQFKFSPGKTYQERGKTR